METCIERSRTPSHPVPQVLTRVLPSLGSMKRGTGTSLGSEASLPEAGPRSAPVLPFWSPQTLSPAPQVPDYAGELSGSPTLRTRGALAESSVVLWQQGISVSFSPRPSLFSPFPPWLHPLPFSSLGSPFWSLSLSSSHPQRVLQGLIHNGLSLVPRKKKFCPSAPFRKTNSPKSFGK